MKDIEFADVIYAKAEGEPDKHVRRALCALAEVIAGTETQLTVPVSEARAALSVATKEEQ